MTEKIGPLRGLLEATVQTLEDIQNHPHLLPLDNEIDIKDLSDITLQTEFIVPSLRKSENSQFDFGQIQRRTVSILTQTLKSQRS